MTVFVVTLFLPDTVQFDVQDVGTECCPIKSPKKVAKGEESSSQPSLFAKTENFNQPSTVATETDRNVNANNNNDDDHAFFARNFNLELPNYAPNGCKLKSNASSYRTIGANNKSHQTLSRASFTPFGNISKHCKPARKQISTGQETIYHLSLGFSNGHDQLSHAKWSVVPTDKGNGGLRNAVQAAVRSGRADDKMWVGTLGIPTDALENTPQKQDIENKLAMEYDSIIIFCKDSDFNGHYTHYSKQILWPVFHYQIPDNQKSKAFEDHSWVYYVKVNQAFADKIVKNWKRGDVIWVHDYHLLLVPQMIRKQLPDAKIGFFLHVAFPSSEVFRCLAVRNELLEGMLGANLIGFQIHEYARHFLQTCSRLLHVEATNKSIRLEDRFVDVIALAIGIDPVALNMNRTDPDVSKWVKTMQERYRGKKLIVARDKLDHVRGVRSKLLAYEFFLNKYPEWRHNVVMIQVATSTTEQAELDATVSDIVTRVNSSWANLAYQPLIYLKQDISYAQYLALLSVADALMITSQREGMNLTCHEFIFCQDGKVEGQNKNGCLILSEFTGSTSVFDRNELSVNPWDYRQCAEALKAALVMSDDEKQLRWNNLYKAVMHHTAEHWYISFLAKLDEVFDEQHLHHAASIPRLSVNQLEQAYQQSNKRLFILDYEGTLAACDSYKDTIVTTTQRTIDVLNDLLQDERNIVYVMSSRQLEDLDKIFNNIPNLGLVAENGCYIKIFGSSVWNEEADLKEMQEWKESVEGIMQYYHERTPESWIEDRNCSLIFHYETCEDQETASRLAGDCANHINDACEEQHVRAISIQGAVAVEPILWSKGTAAKTIFEKLNSNSYPCQNKINPIDFLLVISNNRDGETVIHWANELGRQKIIENVTTVSLGSRNTEAGFTLTQGVTGVLTLLQKLAMNS